MTRLRVLASRLLGWLTGRAHDGELDGEMQAHLDLLTDDYLRSGLSGENARAAARRAFGGVLQVREAHRDERTWLFASHLSRDIWLAIRRAGREPRLVAVIAITIGLGVGANAAMLDAAARILFRPLPVARPSEVVSLYNVDRETGKYMETSYADFEDYRQRLPSLRGLALYLRTSFGWVEDDQLRIVSGEFVTPNYFSLLEVAPVVGTSFDRERQVSSWPMVAMIAEDTWRRTLAADPATIGRVVSLSGQSFTIVGVVPRTFGGYNLNWGRAPEVWVPLEALERIRPVLRQAGILSNRGMPLGVMLGRLWPGTSVEQLQAQAAAVAASLAAESPRTNAHLGVVTFPAARAKFYPGYRDVVSRSLGAFVIATGFVFLLAACNLLTIVSQRYLRRQRELAVRLSLGGSRGRIVQQLLAEGAVFALPGLAIALIAASGVQHAVNQFPDMFGTRLFLDLSMTWHTVAIALASSLAMAGLLALPAVRLHRVNLASQLTHDDRTMSRSQRGWLRTLPVAIQLVVSAVLLAGACLVFRSVLAGRGADLGFDREHLLVVEFERRPGHEPEDGLAAVLEAARSVEALSIVRSTSVSSSGPLEGFRSAILVGLPSGGPPVLDASQLRVGPRFFDTAGIAIARGRALGAEDLANASHVGVVSENLARRLWPDREAVGQTLLVAWGKATPERVQVVGVAPAVRYANPWDDQLLLYRLNDTHSGPTPALLVRTAGPAAHAVADVRRALTILPAGLLQPSLATADAQLDSVLQPEEAAGLFLAVMAGLAVIVAGIGLHHTLAYTVDARRREIAVRIAVGGTPGRVSAEILRSSIALALLAAVAGTIASAAFTPLLTTQARGVPTDDGATYLIVGVVLFVASAGVAALSVVRAARTNPVELLRLD